MLRNCQGSQVSSFDFTILYTLLPHDLIKAKELSLVKLCFNRESKTYLCTSDMPRNFSNKKYDSYICWTCTELCETWKIYVQFDGMVYEQVLGDSYGHKLCSTYSQLISILLRGDFMANLQQSKRFDLIDKFNDISRYLDDIFTINTPKLMNIFPIFIQENFS